MNWDQIAQKSLRREKIDPEEAMAVLTAPDSEILAILQAAYRVRSHFHGRTVKIHILLNAMSGLCPEDCRFCSQSSIATGEMDRYRLLSKEELVAAAQRAKANGAWKFCIVTSTRGPNNRQLDVICEAVRQIKRTIGIRVCTSLGILEFDQACRLKEAGVDRFNHNLETSEGYFPEICSTHTYEDRTQTIERVKEAGMQACCGGIIGMGESLEDIVDLAFSLRELEVSSIPINFLDPRPGTPLVDRPRLDPRFCLKVLAMFRFVNPSCDLRAAGGREVNLRSLQPLALYAVNSIFTNGYLTTPGNDPNRDYEMIRDAGFEIYREEES